MNETLELLRVIGSPFVEGTKGRPAEDEVQRLLDCATDNKIWLMFLDALKRDGALGELESLYHSESERYSQTLITAQRVGQFLAESGVDYALYKTLKPFPVTPNDVDVLLLGDRAEQDAAIAALQEAGFTLAGIAPLQTCLYDARDGERQGHGKEGGRYYVDLYREASASYIVYLDKALLSATDQRVETSAGEQWVRTLRPESDLLSTLAHSLFPEQLYTLHDYYTTLHYLARMDAQENAHFVKMAKTNRVSYAARSSLGITAALHEAAHGLAPTNLKGILEALGGPTPEVSNFAAGQLDTPYRLSVVAVVLFLLERARTSQGCRSMLRQIANMWRPRFVLYIMQVARERRTRETY